MHRTGGGTTALYGQRQAGDAVQSGVVTFEYSVYRETVETVNVGYIASLYHSANLATSGPLSIYVDSAGILRYKNTANNNWVLAGYSIAPNTWATFTGSADLDAGTWSLSLNGTSVFTDVAFDQASLVNIGGVAGANGINAIAFLPQPNNNSRFYVDDVLVEVVPEPTGLAFLALGSAGLMARRRR